MPVTPELAEIRLTNSPNRFLVVMRAQSRTVRATFEVEVEPRRREGFGSKRLRHPTELGKLEAAAQKGVLHLCRELLGK